jgi:putative pyruvate formate lyase activating enzyme
VPEHAALVVDDLTPAYRRLGAGALSERVQRALAALGECRLCPRSCGAHRCHGELGTCGTGRRALVDSAFAHLGEEDCLRGRRGSGTIFFGQCNLHCVFCQNASLSHQRAGEELEATELAAVMLELERRGCHNINLVTPTHVVPQILEALALAAASGLKLPLVYNSSGYDCPQTLALLDGVVDVYMPDLKFWEPGTSRRLANAEDYPERARAALKEMHRQVGVLKMDRDGLARRGLLVRHLVMPGQTAQSRECLAWLAHELSADTYVNIMAQYRPAHQVGRSDGKGGRCFSEIDRPPSAAECAAAHEAARAAGLWRVDQRQRWRPFNGEE